MPVVVIAASAGGVQALSKIIKGLPANFPAAVVIVQHRSPKLASLLAKVLARHSKLPVQDADQGARMRPATIYIARADLHLTIRRGRFVYMDGTRIRHLLSSANPLFVSTAEHFGPRAIAVVLTGSGMDGTDGVQNIKARGGMVIAQDETTSEHFGMPGAAIRTGVVDYIKPLSEIPATLVKLVEEQAQRAGV